MIEDFYTKKQPVEPAPPYSFCDTIELNTEHPIYKGHFPDMPVAPGVVLIQLIQNMLSDALGAPIRLRESDNIKFLAVVSPSVERTLTISGVFSKQGTRIETAATISGAQTIYVKFKGIFEIIS